MNAQADQGRRPKVTVGVPVYNGEPYVRQALKGIQDQTLDDFEVIVADNASTDRTREIVQEFVDSDPRFRLLTADRNGGMAWNFNRLIDAAQAQMFIWNASDDVMRPRHLELCSQALLEHPDAALAFSRVVLIGPNDELLGEWDDQGLDFYGKTPSERVVLFFSREVYQAIGIGGVFRTDVLRRSGGLPALHGGDFILAIHLAMRQPWHQVPEQLYECRRHDDQANKSQGGDVVDQVRIYNPDWRWPVAFPLWTMNFAMLRETLTAPTTYSERFRAAAAVLRLSTIPNWRFLPFDIKRNVVRLAKGRYQGAFNPRASRSATR